MTVPSSHQRVIITTSLGRLGFIVPVVSLMTAIVVGAVYLQSQAWQLLVIAILLVVNALAFFLAGMLARQGVERGCGALMILTVWIVFAGAALMTTGVGPALGVTAAVAATLVAALVIAPRGRPWFWLGSILFGAAIWAMGVIPLPWTRFDVGTSPVTWLGARFLLASVVVVLAAQGIRAYRHAALIPTRLTVLAVVLVLTTAAAMSGISILMETLSTRQRVYEHLETDVALKREAVRAWAGGLLGVLDTLAIVDDGLGGFESIAPDNGGTQLNGEAVEHLRGRLSLILDYTNAFREIALVDEHGAVIVSTDPAREGIAVEGWIGSGEDPEGLSGLQVVYDAGSGVESLMFARSLTRDGATQGAVLGWTDLTALRQIAQSGAGEKPLVTYLVGPDFTVLTEALRLDGAQVAFSDATDSVARDPAPASAPNRASYTNHKGVSVLGAYAWVDDLKIGLVSEVPATQAVAGGRTRTLVGTALAVLASLMAGALAFAAAQDVVQPLSELSDAVLSVADGDLDQVVDVGCDDEVGALAESFNVMSAQLQDRFSDLERRLRARTRALEAVEVASEAATSALAENELLQRIVDVTQERFGLAYVGLFLLDDERRYAVLRAGTGEVGATMLASGWRLLAGGASMIGQCVATGESLVMQRGSEAVVRLENPLLPDVRSEAAIPVVYGAQVLGAITAQSLQRAAFSDADLAALQALADLVAAALQAVPQSDQGYVARSPKIDDGVAVPHRACAEEVTGYDQRGTAMVPLGRTLLPEVVDSLGRREAVVEGATLRIPLLQGDIVVGILGVERPGGWQPESIALATALAEELTRSATTRLHRGADYAAADPETSDS